MIHEIKGNGIGIDFGIHYKINDNLQIGGRIINLLGKTTWKYKIDDNSERSNTEVYPGILSAGFRYNLPFSSKLLGQIDAPVINHNSDANNQKIIIPYENLRIRLGNETIINEIYIVRLGLNQFSPTLGIGILSPLWKKYRIQCDYSLDLGLQNEGISHNFSWAILP